MIGATAVAFAAVAWIFILRENALSYARVTANAAERSDRKLHFPLLADFEPKGAVARSYGVYRQADGFTERALFVIDPKGTIHWSYVSPVGVNPGADGILEALEDLASQQEKP